jgi:hypothetical protein
MEMQELQDQRSGTDEEDIAAVQQLVLVLEMNHF